MLLFDERLFTRSRLSSPMITDSHRNPIFRKILPAARLAAKMPDARNGLGSDQFHQP
jgi:hypothetical protein